MRASDKPRTSHRLEPRTLEWIECHFKSLSGGAEWTTEWAVAAMRKALNSLRGRFSAGELCAMLDISNSTHLTPTQTGPQHLALSLEDGCRLEGLADKWSIDCADMVQRVRDLSHVEAAALQVWAAAYWQADHYETVEPLQYVAPLSETAQ